MQNNQWSLEHCSVLCIIQFAAPFAQKCDHLPPPPKTNTFLKRPFLTDFKKYTHTPPAAPKGNEILVHWTKSSQNPGEVPKPTALAHTECPRETCNPNPRGLCTMKYCTTACRRVQHKRSCALMHQRLWDISTNVSNQHSVAVRLPTTPGIPVVYTPRYLTFGIYQQRSPQPSRNVTSALPIVAKQSEPRAMVCTEPKVTNRQGNNPRGCKSIDWHWQRQRQDCIYLWNATWLATLPPLSIQWTIFVAYSKYLGVHIWGFRRR